MHLRPPRADALGAVADERAAVAARAIEAGQKLVGSLAAGLLARSSDHLLASSLSSAAAGSPAVDLAASSLMREQVSAVAALSNRQVLPSRWCCFS